MGRADLVLGIKWLASLNTIQVNWNEMILFFNLNGKEIKLQGVANRSSTIASFQSLSKEPETAWDTIPLQFKKSVLESPIPVNVKELHGSLGLTSYYHRLVKGYGQIGRPLTDLTKKNAFRWSPRAEAAFIQLNTTLTTAPILHMLDFSKQFTVECDASLDGFGAILL
ncbi:Ty3/gypsy retrotransposon protein [Senna tora]|uniref:Ty3/gypsy retrotransposon protein n=1 Tax=Senna tora TaxID=362788 RepID=A0A834WUW4_9FABA|nr:Ty3/gypsy retrotransposon protein [Senna tora]